MKRITTLLLGLLPFTAFAQLPGGTDIWLFDLKMDRSTVSLTDGKNITKDNSGYDNQPAFAPSGDYLLFSSERGGGQTDIYKYTLRTGATEAFLQTPTSEFSPTFVPGQKYVSTVMIEKDSTQRLWRTLINGKNQEVVFDKLDSVGYHCWFDEKCAFFFVLTQPFSLVMMDNKLQHPKTVATNIGRSMQTYTSAARKMLLYMQAADSNKYSIQAIDGDGMACRDFLPIPALAGSQDFVVTKNGTLIMAKGTKVYTWTIGKSASWTEAADLSAQGLKSITRIAITKSENRIAFVDNPVSN